MKGYLSIGAVSKLKGVSIKSLRYYDRIGAFKPAYVNEKTNYRYYKENQLYLLDAISLCVELGIPLRDFEKYRDAHDNFRLQDLLYDGKLLAEQKILDIRKSLGQVQMALQALDAGETPTANAAPLPKQQAPSIPEGFERRSIPERAVLLSPLPEGNVDDYGQMILRLFMLAQLLGMKGSYPSGIMHEYDAQGNLKKYIYIQVENYGDCQDKRLRMLPAGDYLCKQSDERRIENTPQLRQSLSLNENPFIAIESDVLSDGIKDGENAYELQFLIK